MHELLNVLPAQSIHTIGFIKSIYQNNIHDLFLRCGVALAGVITF